MDVQVRQVNAGGLDQFVGIEEHVVVPAAVGVGRVADEGQLGLIDGLSGVDDAVAVVVVLTGTVFVVVVPLSKDQTGVVRTVLVVINGHRCVVAGVNIAVLVDGVEGISVVLEVERNKVAAHAGQVDVRDGEGLVGPRIIVAQRTGITRMTEPVGVAVEDLGRTRILVVDGTLWLLVLLVAVAFASALKGLLTDGRWRTAVHVGRRGRVNGCLNTKVHRGVPKVVRDHGDVKGALGVKATRVEVLDGLNGGVVEIEGRYIADGIVVDVLFVPGVVGNRCGNPVGCVVEQVGLNRRGVLLAGLQVAERADGGGLRLWVGQESRVLLPDGQVVNSVAVSAAPTGFVVVSRGTFEAGAESESNVDGFAGPRGQVKSTEVFFGEVVPAVVGSCREEAVVNDVLGSCAPGVLLEQAVVVKATPNGRSGRARTFDGSLLRATNEVPSRFLAADLNDGEVVPDVANDEARAVGISEGTETEMAEEFDAHESTVSARQVDIVEHHGVVPVLSVAAPRVAG